MFLLLCTVYADVSKKQFFQRTGLDYRDLCDPSLLVKNPALYFGWMASNIESYRTAVPHEGYKILLKWKETYFSGDDGDDDKQKSLTEELRKRMRDETSIRPLKAVKGEPTAGADLPGRFFVHTTNVDGYFLKAGFLPQEVNQTHGSYERVQCSGLRREGRYV